MATNIIAVYATDVVELQRRASAIARHYSARGFEVVKTAIGPGYSEIVLK